MVQTKSKPKFKVKERVYLPVAINWSDEKDVTVGAKIGTIFDIGITTTGEYSYQVWCEGTEGTQSRANYLEKYICRTPEDARRIAVKQISESFEICSRTLEQRVAKLRELLKEPLKELRRVRAKRKRFEEQEMLRCR